MNTFRKTAQHLLPLNRTPVPHGLYDIYPAFPVPAGTIQAGYVALAQQLVGKHAVVIDGYIGILWDDFRQHLDQALQALGQSVVWRDVREAYLPTNQIMGQIKPFLDDDDSIFGKRYTGELKDFFLFERLASLGAIETSADLTIVYGEGAALAVPSAYLVYVDLPKNEIQFRSRAGSVCNLGAEAAEDPQKMYKRFYFVDWVVLNQHKARLLERIDLMVDGQRPEVPTFMQGATLREALVCMSQNYFRVRPWFEPGVWGGQWIKRHIPQLAQDVPNYAWSFELISPENGLIFSNVDDGLLLEVSFDCLMYQAHHAVLGDCAEYFGYEFPIRFDFLDTFEGGNLSVQCHPRPEYIKAYFGENFTQDETYYILDCTPDARVYLGFQDDIDPAAFRADLERASCEAVAVDVERYVQSHPAHKGDLFLIPNGTIHCSGINNLVLEISATPYIFTFKMYDWMRLDLNGKPRPLNIEHAFKNLYFDRKGERIQREFIAQPRVLLAGADWQVVHLPTHPEHFYDVHRLEFSQSVEVETNGSVHVLNLVEGQSIILETSQGMRQQFNYAETFVVPAAARRYRLINQGTQPVKVVKAFMKP